MATITTVGGIDSLLPVQMGTFETAVAAVGGKFYDTLIDVYYDVAYQNFSGEVVSSTEIDAYLYGVGGYVTLIGSGIYSNNPKFTLVEFDGNDGFSFAIRGAFSYASIKLTEISAAWNGDEIFLAGSLNETGSGQIKQARVSSDGLTATLLGSMTYSESDELSGNLTSVTLADASGNSISFKGTLSASAWQTASGQSVDELLATQSLLAGSDTFNVPDAARAWHGYAGNDKLQGGDLEDELHGDEGNDKLYGYGGNDILVGGDGNDSIDGGAGNDILIAGAGNDKIVDSAGDNLVSDSSGNASITLGDGADSVTTGSGNDKIVAGGGANQIDAGDGNNKVTALSGDDTITTGSGNDNISAGDGHNTVVAGAGNDKVVAGSGNDILNGGAGADKLTGGSGNDSFVFDNLAQGGIDSISDFLALNDVLVFDDGVFTALAGGVAAENLVVGASVVAQDGNDYLLLDTRGGKLYYDADGSGAGAAIQIALLKGVTGLDVSNLLVE